MQRYDTIIDDVTGKLIPQSTIVQIINRQLGTVLITPHFYAVDVTLQPVSLYPTQADPSEVTKLVLVDSSTEIQHDTTRPAHRSLSVTFQDPAYTDGSSFPLDPRQHYLKVKQTYACAGYTFTVQLGVFKFFLPEANINPGQRTFKWLGYDLSSLLLQTPFLSDWVVRKQYPGGFVQAMIDMMTAAGVPKSLGGTGVNPAGNDDAGPQIPLANILIAADPSGTIVPAPLTYSAGTHRMDALNAMAKVISYYDIWVDEIVRFRTSQRPVWSNGIPPIGWDYSTLPASSIVSGNIKQDFLKQDAIKNVVRIVADSTSGSTTVTYSRIMANTTPSSVVAITNLKTLGGGPQAIGYFEKINIPNQQAVDLAAKVRLQQGAMVQEELVFATAPNPFHQDHDLLVFQVTDKNGKVIIPSSPSSPFEEKGWKLQLGANGKMTHTLTRIVVL